MQVWELDQLPVVVHKPEGAPLGLQITGAWGRDDALVNVAAELESLL